MPEKVPVVYSAHHASDAYDFLDLDARCALTPEQRTRFSDYGTAETVPQHGMTKARIARWSRGIVDVNNPDDRRYCFKTEDYGKSPDGRTPDRHKIWHPGQEPTESEKNRIMAEIYYPWYERLMLDLRTLEEKKELLVFGWDNTADYVIGKNESGQEVWMPDYILSNGGDEEKTHSTSERTPLCDPKLLELYAHNLKAALQEQSLPDEIHYNLVYKGGNIPETFSHIRNPKLDVQARVQSLQMEYNTRITHDQKTLEPYPEKIAALRIAAERAMEKTYADLLTHPSMLRVDTLPSSLDAQA